MAGKKHFDSLPDDQKALLKNRLSLVDKKSSEIQFIVNICGA